MSDIEPPYQILDYYQISLTVTFLLHAKKAG